MWRSAAGFAVSVVAYPRLPNPMPTHWNLQGVADGFAPKPWGPFIAPIVSVGMLGLFAILPRLSPKGFEMDRFQGAYDTVVTALLAFLLLVPFSDVAPNAERRLSKTVRLRSRDVLIQTTALPSRRPPYSQVR